jgi:YidC/Oxa1 family membrane protein insertase
MLAASEITSKHIDPQQRWIMRTLPVVFTIFLLTFPAGLFMYWITSNLVTLVQNYVIYNYGPGKKSTEGESGSAKTVDKPKASTGSQRAKGPSAGGGAVAAQGNGGSQDARSAKRKRRRKKKK